MEKDERVLTCFQQEIADITEAKIAAIKQELAAMQQRMEQEMQAEAEAKAQQWYGQEAQELSVTHAVEMSRLQDETHHRLMKERAEMVNSLFEQVKERLCAFRAQADYRAFLLEKLQRYIKAYPHSKVYVAAFDEALMKELLAQLSVNVPCEVAADITIGGFRLVDSDAARIIEETFDSALEEARETFLRTSGLTIA